MAQKRSENTYQKINTIFKRDAKNIIMPYAAFTEPEYEYLRSIKWHAEEKIDGTNIRIEVIPSLEYRADGNIGIKYTVCYKGKTDNAQVPAHLMEYLQANYPKERVLSALGIEEFTPMTNCNKEQIESIAASPTYTIYGEGYGVKIQKGGNYIKDGVGFIVFDVKVGNMYLLIPNRNDIAEKLGAPVVPYIGDFTIDEAIDFVRKGFKSKIAENKDYMAEGLVLRTHVGLRNRRGERLITKIKHEDFIKYRNTYGTDDEVEQPINTHY